MVEEVRPSVFYVGVQDTISKFFDNLMPLPDGTSYNSYLIIGSEKNVLIDTVDPRFADELLSNIGNQHIDFVIANHAEQDHTGALPKVVAKYPNIIIITNEKCKHALQKELHLPIEQFKVIQDNEELSLGNKTLKFMFAPWVHWPETMFTYLVEDKILFTCDLFGAHLATDKLWVQSKQQVAQAAKRYYAQIMMPFSKMVKKYTAMVKEMNVSVIAPSHGPVYGDPNIILDMHEKWVSDKIEPRVVIIYATMHHSTQRIVEHLEWKLKEQGVDCISYDVTTADIGKIVMSLINCATLVVASPAYLGGLHPAVANGLFLLNGFHPNVKTIGFLNSFGWEEQCGYEQVKSILHRLHVEFLPAVNIEGYPDNNGFVIIDKLVEQIKSQHENC